MRGGVLCPGILSRAGIQAGGFAGASEGLKRGFEGAKNGTPFLILILNEHLTAPNLRFLASLCRFQGVALGVMFGIEFLVSWEESQGFAWPLDPEIWTESVA